MKYEAATTLFGYVVFAVAMFCVIVVFVPRDEVVRTLIIMELGVALVAFIWWACPWNRDMNWRKE
jgi:hypothetical protein